MFLLENIQDAVNSSLEKLLNQSFTSADYQINQTKPEFEGDYTIVLFSLLKKAGMPPNGLGEKLGTELLENNPALFSAFNVIKGFLNLTIADSYWLQFLQAEYNNEAFGKAGANGRKVMVEYSSPNTNKPLHLGHLRNNFLGRSVAEILKESGYNVVKTCIVNDRGVHICKSMLAWQKWGNGETPESTNIKGDHLVGDYYVKFENELKQETAGLKAKDETGDLSFYEPATAEKISGIKEQLLQLQTGEKTDRTLDKIAKLEAELTEIRRASTPIMKEVKEMLQKWEAGDEEVMALWEKMNGWVYAGFDETYHAIGSDFDKIYYESNTYLLGKTIVQQGLDKGIFFRKDDGSVWIDLSDVGLDEKLLLRKDGTSVYITQDLGLAQQKYDEYKIDESIYVIGDEQNYHMKVLKEIATKMGMPFAHDIHHLSYGMVELPSGRMKSREGTVVDADDIVAEMEKEAAKTTEELGKVSGFSGEELKELYHTIGVGALKFFLLRVDPKRKMVFNPEESIDFHGFTAPFIQFNYARIKSILRKNEMKSLALHTGFLPLEKELVVSIEKFPAVIRQAAAELNPSLIAIYVYQLSKTFSSFYTEHSIANAESEEKKQLRLMLSTQVAHVIKNGMRLLGISVPERM